ncbi:hypothetical protein Hanom_Chr09g00815511 [Helianthus anomalus]
MDDFLNDELNEQEEDQHQESSSSGIQLADQVFLTQPTVIYLNAPFEGELEVPRSRAEMLEELGLDDGKFKFDIEDEIPSLPEKEYEFKYAHEADNFHHVEVEDSSNSSEEDTPFHYSGLDDSFPTLAEMFKVQNEDEIRRKVVEKISTEGIPRTIPRETLAEERNGSKSCPRRGRDILSWGYLEDLQVYAIRREQGVQYFEFISDIKTLPWWDVEELVQTKNIKKFYHGLDVKQHDQHLWKYIKLQPENRFPDCKPQFLEQDIKIDPVTVEKDITLNIKPPRCLKNMVGCTAEAMISLFDKKTGESRRISVLDPMWLVNCSKKDIDCLFYKKIVYEKPDKVQAQQSQKLGNLCYAKDINSGRYWKSKFRDLEIDEFLKKYKRSQRFKEIVDKATKLGRYRLIRPPPTDLTPIEKEENKIPRWDRKRDGDLEYKKYWDEVGRPLRRKMLAERDEKRRQKAKEKRRSRKQT